MRRTTDRLWRATVRRKLRDRSYFGKNVSLGNFATAAEAALFIARSPEGQEAAARAAAALVPLTSEWIN